MRAFKNYFKTGATMSGNLKSVVVEWQDIANSLEMYKE